MKNLLEINPRGRPPLLLAAALLALGAACPVSATEKLTVRTTWMTNPRLKNITPEQYEAILERSRALALDWLDLDLEFTENETISVHDFFARYLDVLTKDANFAKHRLSWDEQAKEGSVDALTKAFLSDFKKETDEEVRAMVENQAEAKRIDLSQDKAGIFRQVAELHIDKLQKIAEIKLEDGEPLLRGDGFNEYMAWTCILRAQNDYDLILSNQLLGSVESLDPSVHSSMRGGVTSGFAEKGPTEFGGSVLIGMFPFISEHERFVKERGENYDPDTEVETIAFMVVHELGHLLQGWGHHYDHPGCVMRPAPGLRYKEWTEEIKANGPCKKEHPPKLADYFEKPEEKPEAQ